MNIEPECIDCPVCDRVVLSLADSNGKESLITGAGENAVRVYGETPLDRLPVRCKNLLLGIPKKGCVVAELQPALKSGSENM